MDRLMIRWLSPVPLKLAAALAAVGGVSACAALSQAPIRTGQAQMADVQTPRQPLAAIGADTAAAAPAPDRFWSTPASPTAGHKPARSGDKTYRAEFRDADLKDFARTILGDLLGEAYVIDPNVQGPVAAASAGKLTRAELLNLLEAAAQQNNAALTRVGGVWRLTPQDSPNRGARLLRPDEAGFGVSSFPLRNITPARAQALLEAMLPRAGAVKTDANSVIVSGTGAERAAVAEALAALDSSWLAGLSAGLFPLQNAAAADLAAELRKAAEAAGGAKGLIIEPIARINGLLVVAPDDQAVQLAAVWIRQLDVAARSASMLRTYRLNNMKASEGARLVGGLFGADLGGAAATSGAVTPDQRRVSIDTAERMGARAAQLPASTSASSAATAPGGLRIIADDANNALLILANPAEHDLIARALLSLDRAPRQVMIDAMIAEVTLNDSLRFGVQYFFETAGIDGIGADGRGGFSSGTGQTPSPTFPGFNFIMDTKGQARLALDALSQTTDVKVVSAPSVVVMENRSAILQVGDQVPVVTRQAQGVVNPDAPIVNQVEFRDTGVILNVTPRISADGTVTLDIEQEVSNVAATRGANPTLTPTIAQRRIASTVSVENGRTIALGGLIDEQRQDSKSGLPVLQDLPWIGRAFGNTQATTRRTELIVFITPRIITDGDDARALARDLADRMRHMQAGAIETPATPAPAPKPRRRR
jgi:general secretion pathway protein D